MHLRVTRGRFDPARLEELRALIPDVAEAFKGLPGFLSYQGGLDEKAGTVVAISTWEDAQAANFPREKLGEVLPRILDIAQVEPSEIYEIVATS